MYAGEDRGAHSGASSFGERNENAESGPPGKHRPGGHLDPKDPGQGLRVPEETQSLVSASQTLCVLEAAVALTKMQILSHRPGLDQGGISHGFWVMWELLGLWPGWRQAGATPLPAQRTRLHNPRGGAELGTLCLSLKHPLRRTAEPEPACRAISLRMQLPLPSNPSLCSHLPRLAQVCGPLTLPAPVQLLRRFWVVQRLAQVLMFTVTPELLVPKPLFSL